MNSRRFKKTQRFRKEDWIHPNRKDENDMYINFGEGSILSESVFYRKKRCQNRIAADKMARHEKSIATI